MVSRLQRLRRDYQSLPGAFHGELEDAVSRKYFEAIGRQARSLGRRIPPAAHSLQLPDWATTAVIRGYNQQIPWRKAIQPRARELAATSMRPESEKIVLQRRI